MVGAVMKGTVTLTLPLINVARDRDSIYDVS